MGDGTVIVMFVAVLAFYWLFVRTPSDPSASDVNSSGTPENTTSVQQQTPSSTTAVQPTVSSTPSHVQVSCFESGVDYTGNDITATPSSSPSECQTLCQAVQQCQFFMHDSAANTCFLKTSNSGRRVTYAANTAGPKNC